MDIAGVIRVFAGMSVGMNDLLTFALLESLDWRARGTDQSIERLEQIRSLIDYTQETISSSIIIKITLQVLLTWGYQRALNDFNGDSFCHLAEGGEWGWFG